MMTLQTISLSSSYEHYKGNLTKKEYVKILKVFFWWCSRIMITERVDMKFPIIGTIGIRKLKKSSVKNHKYYDYGHYQKTGELKTYLNLHSNRDIFKWRLLKKDRLFPLKNFFKFEAARGCYQNNKIGKRGLSAYIKKCSEDPYLKDYEVNEY